VLASRRLISGGFPLVATGPAPFALDPPDTSY
jgi:hypothetical protein